MKIRIDLWLAGSFASYQRHWQWHRQLRWYSPSCSNKTRSSLLRGWSSPHCLMTTARRVVKSAACWRIPGALVVQASEDGGDDFGGDMVWHGYQPHWQSRSRISGVVHPLVYNIRRWRMVEMIWVRYGLTRIPSALTIEIEIARCRTLARI